MDGVRVSLLFWVFIGLTMLHIFGLDGENDK